MDARSPELDFEYQVSEEDFARAYLTHCRSGELKRTIFYYLLPILGIASVLYGVVTAIQRAREGEDWGLSIVFFAVGVAWLFCHIIRPWRVKRLYRKNPRFGAPVKVNIEWDEWKVSTATTEARFKEGTFVRAMETETFFLLYHSPVMFNIVPKNQLTPEQQAGVRAFLDRALPIRRGRFRLPATA
jgi:YcxB-like protein